MFFFYSLFHVRPLWTWWRCRCTVTSARKESCVWPYTRDGSRPTWEDLMPRWRLQIASGACSMSYLKQKIHKAEISSITRGQYCHGDMNLRLTVNSLRPRPNRRHFADDIFKCILENENGWISPRISRKFVSKVRINNIPALVQIMAWRRPGDKPLSEPMIGNSLTHTCVTRPQWVK